MTVKLRLVAAGSDPQPRREDPLLSGGQVDIPIVILPTARRGCCNSPAALQRRGVLTRALPGLESRRAVIAADGEGFEDRDPRKIRDVVSKRGAVRMQGAKCPTLPTSPCRLASRASRAKGPRRVSERLVRGHAADFAHLAEKWRRRERRYRGDRSSLSPAPSNCSRFTDVVSRRLIGGSFAGSWKPSAPGADISAIINEKSGFDEARRAVALVTGEDVPMPYRAITSSCWLRAWKSM